jgi:class 3 adenylate cyclase
VLVRHDAIIDKLIGDEVMALFIPGICGPNITAARCRQCLTCSELLDTTERGKHGCPVNTASRLSSLAAVGEVLISDTVYASVNRQYPHLERRRLSLREKMAPVDVRVLHPSAA